MGASRARPGPGPASRARFGGPGVPRASWHYLGVQAPPPRPRARAAAVTLACGLALGLVGVAIALALASGQRAPARSPVLRAARAEGALSSTQSISSDWSGYVVTAPGVTYTSATATWTQPAVFCSVAGAGAGAESAFWVGLGGYDPNSQSLEQIGSDSDCNRAGRPEYYAWYELVPAAAVPLGLRIEPGNTVTVSVNAIDGGTTIELQIINRTLGVRVTKLLPFAAADLSSAEWITEAPSECAGVSCRTQPLADFGSVSFSRVAARGNGLGGTITDPSWTADEIELQPGSASRDYFPGRVRSGGSPHSSAGATPVVLSASGTAFSIDWVADAPAA